MAKKTEANPLPGIKRPTPKVPVIGVFGVGDPRLDEDGLARSQNAVKIVADTVAGSVVLPDKTPAPVVYSTVLAADETQADLIAEQFRKADVDVIICVSDTPASPRAAVSLVGQFPPETPFNITCSAGGAALAGAQAIAGALAQHDKLAALNVGPWIKKNGDVQMAEQTAKGLIDWCYAAVTAVALRGRRVVLFGPESIVTDTRAIRNTFGLEITRLDTRLPADLLAQKAYKEKDLKDLRGWMDRYVGKRVELQEDADSERWNASLALYLVVREIVTDLNAVGGAFASRRQWDAEPRGLPRPAADVMKAFFNSSFDHTGSKAPLPFATGSDVPGLLTMLPLTYLAGGNPPLSLERAHVWEPQDVQELAGKLALKKADRTADWHSRGLLDGTPSSGTSLDWAAGPAATVKQVMDRITMPLVDVSDLSGPGNRVTFATPTGIDAIAARLACRADGRFGLIWDEVRTPELPDKLRDALSETAQARPHLYLVPKYAGMSEYRQYWPADRLHLTWNLPVARVQHWTDLTEVLSVTPWSARPSFVEGVDRPRPLLRLIDAGESVADMPPARD